MLRSAQVRWNSFRLSRLVQACQGLLGLVPSLNLNLIIPFSRWWFSTLETAWNLPEMPQEQGCSQRRIQSFKWSVLENDTGCDKLLINLQWCTALKQCTTVVQLPFVSRESIKLFVIFLPERPLVQSSSFATTKSILPAATLFYHRRSLGFCRLFASSWAAVIFIRAAQWVSRGPLKIHLKAFR